MMKIMLFLYVVLLFLGGDNLKTRVWALFPARS